MAAYDAITWYTVDGGGRVGAVGGPYRLSGTIGQPDAGVLAGGDYSLRGGFWRGGASLVLDTAPRESTPLAFRFFAPAPNPARAVSRVSFDAPIAADARLRVFDVTGRVVRTVDFGRVPPGRHDRTWSTTDDTGRPLPNGAFFLRLEVGDRQGVKRVLVLR